MKKNHKLSLIGGVSIMILMLLVLGFKSSFKNSQERSSDIYVLLENCDPSSKVAYSKPLPPPDTNYAIYLWTKPSNIYFCYNSPVKENKQLKATLSGTDTSMVITATPEIYQEPVTISGEKFYPASVRFALNQKPIGDMLEFTLIGSGGKIERYVTVFLNLNEKK